MEKIQDEVARAGLSESYFESGPQSVTQLVISFSRGYEMEKIRILLFLLFPGRFDASIIFGVVVSVLSLSWGSSRAFFIERTPDQANHPFPSSLADFPAVFFYFCHGTQIKIQVEIS